MDSIDGLMLSISVLCPVQPRHEPRTVSGITDSLVLGFSRGAVVKVSRGEFHVRFYLGIVNCDMGESATALNSMYCGLVHCVHCALS